MLVSTPSIRASEAEALAFFRKHGFLVEQNLVPHDHCQDVVAFAHTLPNANDNTFRPVSMPHRVDERFLRLMKLPRIVEIVEKLVGGTASGIGGEFFFMHPGTPGFARHQDNSYVQAPSDEFVSAWTALNETSTENGCLKFYPGSHKLGLLPTRELEEIFHAGQNPGARSVESIMPVGYSSLDMEVDAGSTVFFHSLLVHGSNPNVTRDRFRHSFLATYIQQGISFRAGNSQRRAEVDLHT